MEDCTGLNVRPHLLCLWFVGFNACVLYAWLVFWYGHFSAVVLQVNRPTSSSLSRSSSSSHGVNYPPVPVFAARLSSGKRIDLFNRCLDVLLLLSGSLILQIQQTPVSLCSLGRVDWLTVHRQGFPAPGPPLGLSARPRAQRHWWLLCQLCRWLFDLQTNPEKKTSTADQHQTTTEHSISRNRPVNARKIL